MAASPATFLADHPDVQTWTPADYESYEVLTENTGKTPQRVSPDWRYAPKDPATQPLAHPTA